MHLLTAGSLVALVLFGLVRAPQQPPLVLSQLTWFDRAGRSQSKVGPLADHGNIELSPDETRIASAVADRAVGTRDIWIYGAPAGGSTRLTSSRADENWMVWTADGMRGVLNAFGPEGFDLFEIPVRADSAPRLLAVDAAARWPVSLSPDGRYLLYVVNSPRTGNDIWVLPMTGGQRAYPFQQTEASENWATFSPDGRYVAFSTTETGVPEVVITPFPGPGPKWRVSAETGTQARWRRIDELIYIDGEQRLTSASLRLVGDTVELAGVASLFRITYPYGAYHSFDVTRDGRRFIVNTTVVSGREPATNAVNQEGDAGPARLRASR